MDLTVMQFVYIGSTACAAILLWKLLAHPKKLQSVLTKHFFIWINPLLLNGYRRKLVWQDLPPLAPDIKPGFSRKAMLHTWAQRAKPEKKSSLPLTLATCFNTTFFAAIVPRLLMIIFRYSQPLLIKESIRYVTEYHSEKGCIEGRWLVLSAITVYTGLALSTASYQRCITKLKLLTKSGLLGLIHDKILKSRSSSAADNGEAITLISTDVEGPESIGEMFHETWAQIIEVVIGVRLLANQVGWIWPLPLILIYLCSYTSRYVAKHLQPRQKAWNEATQDRLALTSTVLAAMRDIKMLGIQQSLTNRIQELREKELQVAAKLRRIMAYYNASANALGIFSPAVTLAVFAVMSVARGSKLTTGTAFTTVAVLGMVTHRANMIMTIVPRTVAALVSLERIQAFLLRPDLETERESVQNSDPRSIDGGGQNPAIAVEDLTIGNPYPILENVNVEVRQGTLNIISGPTGSGKTTLLRAILGKIVPTRGSIDLSNQDVGYCAQKPWLTRGSIREAIYGATDADHADRDLWYQEVVDICCLAHDISSFPDGDRTRIVSRGANLSGGQRLRVTLARAIFARPNLLLLDDIFSGLDGDTESKIFDNLFGPGGLMRRLKTTVLLVSNSSQHFRFADHVVILGDHGVVDQGSPLTIRTKASVIAKFASSDQIEGKDIPSPRLDQHGVQSQAKADSELQLAGQVGSSSLYRYYFAFIDRGSILFLLITTASFAFFITIPQLWLQLWTDAGDDNNIFYVCGFLLLSTLSWLSTSAQMWSVVSRLAPQSGLRLHHRLLHTVMGASLSYFSSTDIGSLLSRFGQDISVMDKQLPSALQTVTTQIFKLLMQVILLCLVEKWLVVSLPACILVVYLVQKIYLATSMQLRSFELESRAAVISNFLELIEGIETIRAFGWLKSTTRDITYTLENSQRPEFLLLNLRTWLNFVLDLLTAAIASGAVAIAVGFAGNISDAYVGVALNIMLVTNTTLLKLVENWTTLETSMSAVSRLRVLEDTTSLECREGLSWEEPPEDWPSKGRLEVERIAASYDSDSVAIEGVTMNVKHGQKLVICGRTGSGKSTLLLTLLRLLELHSGNIKLDGIDIKRVRPDLLRQRCFVVVSQDPLMFWNETLRFNLDPDAAVSDKKIIDALRQVGLWALFSTQKVNNEDDQAATIPGIDDHRILDQKISALKKLSSGQTQLLALCRAVIRARHLRTFGIRPIAVLDEVTSSLDAVTESEIYDIIDTEFTQRGHTVIIVAHRLGGLKEYLKNGRDAVVLLADGRLRDYIDDLGEDTFSRLTRTE